MAGRKTKKKTAKKKNSTGSGRSLGRLAIFLACAAILFFAMVKYADTPRGRILLLDLGFDRYYTEVQTGLGELVKKGASETGIPEGAVRISASDEQGEPGPVAVVKGDLPAGRSLLQLNVAIDRAVSSGGGRVRRCAEKRNGSVLEIEIGTRTAITHRCEFRINRRAASRTEKPSGPAITVIVDDFGYFNNRRVREFLAVDTPFTVSVIPGLEHSARICRQAREAGKEVICHLPMEPEKNGSDNGEIPLVRTAMSGGEIEDIVERALESTPGVIGMNNHMGSKATSDMRVMDSVMKVCRRKKTLLHRQLYYVEIGSRRGGEEGRGKDPAQRPLSRQQGGGCQGEYAQGHINRLAQRQSDGYNAHQKRQRRTSPLVRAGSGERRREDNQVDGYDGDLTRPRQKARS